MSSDERKNAKNLNVLYGGQTHNYYRNKNIEGILEQYNEKFLMKLRDLEFKINLIKSIVVDIQKKEIKEEPKTINLHLSNAYPLDDYDTELDEGDSVGPKDKD